MTWAAIKNNIDNVVFDVKNASYKERHQDTESLINSLLDKILIIKQFLRGKASEVDLLTEKLEELTWMTFENNETLLKSLNELIVSAKDYANSVSANYFEWGTISGENVATEEIKILKSSIQDFMDTCNDLESIYFKLPKIAGFNDTTRNLASF